MTAESNYRHHSISVGANGEVKLAVGGRYFRILNSNQTSFGISFDSGPTQTIEAGIGFETEEPFRQVTISELTGAALTVDFAVGNRRIDDARLSSAGALTVQGTVNVDIGDTVAGVADASIAVSTTASILAASTTRRRAHIKLDPAHTSACRIGGSGTTGAAQGIELQPGESITLETTAAVHAHNPDATNAAKFFIATESD